MSIHKEFIFSHLNKKIRFVLSVIKQKRSLSCVDEKPEPEAPGVLYISATNKHCTISHLAMVLNSLRKCLYLSLINWKHPLRNLSWNYLKSNYCWHLSFCLPGQSFMLWLFVGQFAYVQIVYRIQLLNTVTSPYTKSPDALWDVLAMWKALY